tara:strand:+ start:495 stop:620 length:126 start_codon:yes stop_codon:yes gene_type:complete
MLMAGFFRFFISRSFMVSPGKDVIADIAENLFKANMQPRCP